MDITENQVVVTVAVQVANKADIKAHHRKCYTPGKTSSIVSQIQTTDLTKWTMVYLRRRSDL